MCFEIEFCAFVASHDIQVAPGCLSLIAASREAVLRLKLSVPRTKTCKGQILDPPTQSHRAGSVILPSRGGCIRLSLTPAADLRQVDCNKSGNHHDLAAHIRFIHMLHCFPDACSDYQPPTLPEKQHCWNPQWGKWQASPSYNIGANPCLWQRCPWMGIADGHSYAAGPSFARDAAQLPSRR